MRVTISKTGVYSEYGAPWPVGTIQTPLTDAYGFSLIQTGQATDTDGYFAALPSNTSFVANPSVITGKTLAQLPAANRVRAGTLAYTTDLGLYESDGVSAWTSVAAGAGAGLGANIFTGDQNISDAEPRYLLNETDQGADLKLWDWDVSAGVLSLRTRTDADGAGTTVISATRGATTAISAMTFGSGASTYNFAGTGTASFGGQVSAPRVGVTGAVAPANGVYLPGTNQLGLTTNGGTLRLTIESGGQIRQITIGAGYSTAEGSNAKQGVATLVAGTVVVSNTSVTASSRIFLGYQSLGTVTTPKGVGVSARVVGTSFTILSNDATDTSVIAYEIFEPS